jgi:hypothetical protein
VLAPGVPTEEIVESHLEALIAEAVAERRTTEYKRELPGNKDSDRKEFLADVSSFANAGGGDLVYGIEAVDGVPVKISPLTITPDAERLTWEQVIRNGVQPRLPGIVVREIEAAGGHVILLRIPRSWVGPHAVTYKGTFRFYSRTSAGKYPLDVGELRAAFFGASGIADQIRDFRTNRLGQIMAGVEPLPLVSDAKIVVHLVPFDAFTTQQDLNLNAPEGSGLWGPLFGAGGGKIRRWNIDGQLTYDMKGSRVNRYSQLFRNGIYEGVDATTLVPRTTQSDDEAHVRGSWFELRVNRHLANPIAVQRMIGVRPPVSVLVSVVSGRGLLVAPPSDISLPYEWSAIDRDLLVLPDVVLETFDIDMVTELPRLLRPVVDGFWQSCGFERSTYYDDEGNWKPPV